MAKNFRVLREQLERRKRERAEQRIARLQNWAIGGLIVLIAALLLPWW